MDISQKMTAAGLLGAPSGEISGVEVTDDGIVISHVDGSTYIDVHPGQPDAAGKTGLMYLTAPCDGYAGSFPVFVGSTAPAPGPVLTDPAATGSPVVPATAPAAPAAPAAPVAPAAVPLKPKASGPTTPPA